MYCSGWQTLQAVYSLSAISTTQLCPSRVKVTIENIYRSMHAVTRGLQRVGYNRTTEHTPLELDSTVCYVFKFLNSEKSYPLDF